MFHDHATRVKTLNCLQTQLIDVESQKTTQAHTEKHHVRLADCLNA